MPQVPIASTAADQTGPLRLLTKTAFLAGNQCPLRLWFEMNEPADEERGPAVQNRLRWGQRIGALARRLFPGGEQVRLVGSNAVPVTRDLLAREVPVVFEAAFETGRAFAAIDILVRESAGFRAIEVKMQSGRHAPGEELLDELAFEYMVLEDAGIGVTRVELLRLNPESRYPALDDLFVATDVTETSRERVAAVRAMAARLLPVLDGARPEQAIGAHCRKPERCPFFDRCNPALAPDDVRRLYKLHHKRRDALLSRGIQSIDQLPDDFPLTDIQRRQVKALRTGQRVVEPGLQPMLDRIAFPIAFLDFETVNLPVPRFDGMGPWQQIPVQLSCHLLQADGGVTHQEWLAEADGDPRVSFARATLAAVAGAATVVAHHASFEADRLKETAAAVPELAEQLNALASSLADTEVWLNQHVYDPAFDSSFSLKKVLPALLGRGYDDLAVQEGLTASALLEQLLWEPDWLKQPADQLRQDLLAYCARDTEALVSLWHALNRMASTG